MGEPNFESAEDRARDMQALRAIYAEWAKGNFHDTGVFTEDIVWITPEGPDGGGERFVGLEEFSRSWGIFLDAWEDLRNEPEEILPTPDGKYLVMQLFRARGRTSGAPIEGRTAVLITMRDGKISRIEGFRDREDARRAAGLEGRER